ncbi:T-box transcription factor TBX21 [Mauremys reevesii]|uniref:T-box transcription factor TBX21 n=1 Tax=Mauremys reevesii TaxID=260615 RepID=UPI00193F437E|nr:T-box transcription factor TBX21 [Mauremys reevesii]
MGALEPASGAGSPALTMLNGTDSQSFAKEPLDLQGAKEPAELKMGVPERFYFPDAPAPEGCPLSLPYSPPMVPGGFAGSAPATGRFLGPALNSCSAYRAQPPPAAAQPGSHGFALPPGELYPGGGELYPSPAAGEGCYPAAVQHVFPRGPLYPVPGYQLAGKVQVMLNNYPLWAKFHKHQTEMLRTKQGRRMFPFLSFSLSGLDPVAHYRVCVDIVLVDQHHWRYQGGKWVQCGKAEGNMPGNRLYIHPDSPNTGAHWMRQEVSFGKLKLTNNKGASNNISQMIVLQSLHKYQPRLHVTEVKEGEGDEAYPSGNTQTFIFPETQFIAVTAYQNADITQLKIDHNPFAKGFRDNFDSMYTTAEGDRVTPSPPDATSCQQLLPGSRFPSFLHEQYPLPQSRYYNGDPLQHKEPPRWYFASQQPPAAPLDYSAYEGSYSGNKYVPFGVKAFPLPASPHATLPYYQEPHPFGSPPAAWQPPAKPSPGALGWFRPVRDVRPLPAGEEKGKDAEGWAEPASVKSVDSSDSGLFEAECKRRRVSPYASSAESSPPARNGDLYDKDGGADPGYYGFYGN